MHAQPDAYHRALRLIHYCCKQLVICLFNVRIISTGLDNFHVHCCECAFYHERAVVMTNNVTKAVFRHDLRIKSRELAMEFTCSLPFTHAQHSGRLSPQTCSQNRVYCVSTYHHKLS